jgi:hypothetical protein
VVRHVRQNLLTLFLHYLLNVDLAVSEPPEIVRDQMQVIAAFASQQHYALFVRLLAECACLLGLTLGACECHQKQPTTSTSGPFHLVFIECIRNFLVIILG